MKTKICKACGEEFRLYFVEEGKRRSLYKRSYCLKCSPYDQYIKNKKPLVDGKRQCIRCEVFKPLAEFELRSAKKYIRSCCAKCEIERVREYGQILKQKSVDYLGGKCKKCGYNRCIRSLQFHHRDPSQKDFTISKHKCLNWIDTKKELDKCDLLCANCHGETHCCCNCSTH